MSAQHQVRDKRARGKARHKRHRAGLKLPYYMRIPRLGLKRAKIDQYRHEVICPQCLTVAAMVYASAIKRCANCKAEFIAEH